ncbi:uncharacterized protein CLUP02_01215 [Colletotrichum lupini]|uniref:Uncharacterized protein n=1 Tax=Colletotrichum lupini TaxID=145971 RepID=A0A9Q8SC90_9PEZI|nr:uncharacterized protein CLUP02_01215 [Colletotrichum lupini]UQC74564.1 hypothetical protein CLUP02_01215 [Colletotrichum lupini]
MDLHLPLLLLLHRSFHLYSVRYLTGAQFGIPQLSICDTPSDLFPPVSGTLPFLIDNVKPVTPVTIPTIATYELDRLLSSRGWARTNATILHPSRIRHRLCRYGSGITSRWPAHKRPPSITNPHYLCLKLGTFNSTAWQRAMLHSEPSTFSSTALVSTEYCLRPPVRPHRPALSRIEAAPLLHLPAFGSLRPDPYQIELPNPSTQLKALQLALPAESIAMSRRYDETHSITSPSFTASRGIRYMSHSGPKERTYPSRSGLPFGPRISVPRQCPWKKPSDGSPMTWEDGTALLLHLHRPLISFTLVQHATSPAASPYVTCPPLFSLPSRCYPGTGGQFPRRNHHLDRASTILPASCLLGIIRKADWSRKSLRRCDGAAILLLKSETSYASGESLLVAPANLARYSTLRGLRDINIKRRRFSPERDPWNLYITQYATPESFLCTNQLTINDRHPSHETEPHGTVAEWFLALLIGSSHLIVLRLGLATKGLISLANLPILSDGVDRLKALITYHFVTDHVDHPHYNDFEVVAGGPGCLATDLTRQEAAEWHRGRAELAGLSMPVVAESRRLHLVRLPAQDVQMYDRLKRPEASSRHPSGSGNGNHGKTSFSDAFESHDIKHLDTALIGITAGSIAMEVLATPRKPQSILSFPYRPGRLLCHFDVLIGSQLSLAYGMTGTESSISGSQNAFFDMRILHSYISPLRGGHAGLNLTKSQANDTFPTCILRRSPIRVFREFRVPEVEKLIFEFPLENLTCLSR